ncbi:hypothetical protein NDU88_000556 [Pleurodeles waltl]|uniref:Uncharacterized protein n=1 Tax=Pleurodeles waltl TaxID=8319 RepID=A0AAV7S8Z1_PLEWA|nr:hypothetical protein NDU88_000556 [Pleurodeles waltl]
MADRQHYTSAPDPGSLLLCNPATPDPRGTGGWVLESSGAVERTRRVAGDKQKKTKWSQMPKSGAGERVRRAPDPKMAAAIVGAI